MHTNVLSWIKINIYFFAFFSIIFILLSLPKRIIRKFNVFCPICSQSVSFSLSHSFPFSVAFSFLSLTNLDRKQFVDCFFLTLIFCSVLSLSLPLSLFLVRFTHSHRDRFDRYFCVSFDFSWISLFKPADFNVFVLCFLSLFFLQIHFWTTDTTATDPRVSSIKQLTHTHAHSQNILDSMLWNSIEKCLKRSKTKERKEKIQQKNIVFFFFYYYFKTFTVDNKVHLVDDKHTQKIESFFFLFLLKTTN